LVEFELAKLSWVNLSGLTQIRSLQVWLTLDHVKLDQV